MRFKLRKRMVKIIVGVIISLCIIAATCFGVISYKMSLIPSMTFEEMLCYTTENNKVAQNMCNFMV